MGKIDRNRCTYTPVSLYTVKAHRRKWAAAPLIRNLDTRWRWVVNFTNLKYIASDINWSGRLDRPKKQSGHFGKKNNLLLLSGIKGVHASNKNSCDLELNAVQSQLRSFSLRPSIQNSHFNISYAPNSANKIRRRFPTKIFVHVKCYAIGSHRSVSQPHIQHIQTMMQASVQTHL